MAVKSASHGGGHRKDTDQMQFPFTPVGGPAGGVIPTEPVIPETSGQGMRKRAEKCDTASRKASPPAVRRRTKPPSANEDTGHPATRRSQRARGYATAESMSKAQREISVSEFFAKNRHLLGFDNKRKALLTTVKEAVDNSLDACEEAGILPEIHVKISQSDAERFCVTVRDNGPGIVKNQIPNIFGKLLYGSKFHRLKMSRGQQGIGISAAGMYGLLTTGKSIRVTSRVGKRADAHYYEVQINTKTNAPQVVKDQAVEVEWEHGTEVAIELVASYQKGRSSVDEYIELTAIANPHTSFDYVDPAGNVFEFSRAIDTVPEPTSEIKPHPYGIELGVLIKMLKDTRAKTMAQFLHGEFSRVSPGVARTICDNAGISSRARPTRIGTHEAETLYKAMQETKIRPPMTNCLSPIGPRQILAGLLKGVKAEFFTASTRSPAVYRGNPFQIEVGLAYGGELGPDPSEADEENNNNESVVRRGKVVKAKRPPAQAKLMRFANRVPLLHQLSGCCIYKSVVEIDWRRYGLSQPGGSLPHGPLAIFVHMASVWVPFTSEGKEAVADYDEIRKEIRLAVQDCGRKLQAYLNRRKKQKYQADRRGAFERYIGELVSACASIKRINQRELTANLLAVAKHVTARADEELGLDGKAKPPGKADRDDGKGTRGLGRTRPGRSKGIAAPGGPTPGTLAPHTSGEYGENTIVIDRDDLATGPLFDGTGAP
ncbi:MAG: DNA topoisomerase VI subunit B [Phycisphaerae bacterium]|nr:DNA topoisomerase VI subunit B [Phycisphaerae bacterium]